MMIDMLDNWMLESSGNFTIIGVLTIVIYLGSLLAVFYFGSKIGKSDERTIPIHLNIIFCMFTTQLIINATYISSVDRDIEHFRLIFILFQGIVFLVGAIYAFILYRRDFK